ncbi:hypothetical protein DSECCO2_273260 [anaerobic digester metagenome]
MIFPENSKVFPRKLKIYKTALNRSLGVYHRDEIGRFLQFSNRPDLKIKLYFVIG